MEQPRETATTTVYTIGHSTHSLDEFVKVLQSYDIKAIVDVRTIPRSRHNPQFNMEELSAGLQANGIEYIHMAALGGLRHTTKASVNTGWKSLSFRGYADYMQTPEFKHGVDELIKTAAERRTAIMCAEAVPWRCHRSLIGDALLVRHIEVVNIMDEKTTAPHPLTPWAKVDGEVITCPGETPLA